MKDSNDIISVLETTNSGSVFLLSIFIFLLMTIVVITVHCSVGDKNKDEPEEGL